jgi:hypothetical protein
MPAPHIPAIEHEEAEPASAPHGPRSVAETELARVVTTTWMVQTGRLYPTPLLHPLPAEDLLAIWAEPSEHGLSPVPGDHAGSSRGLHHIPPDQRRSQPRDPMYTSPPAGQSAGQPATVPSSTAETGGSALHRPIVAVDAVASGRYSTGMQLHQRAVLYRIVQSTCAAVGLSWDDSHHEDRGDGILLIPPAEVSAELLLGLFAGHLRASIRRHNQTARPGACLRLRAVVHAGYLCLDGHGVAGRAVNHAFRLLDAPQFRTVIALENAEFGLIISDYLYTEIVREAPGLIDPTLYRPLEISNKEAHEMAWALLPSAHLPQYNNLTNSDPDPKRTDDHAAFESQVCPWLLAHGWSPERIAQALVANTLADGDHTGISPALATQLTTTPAHSQGTAPLSERH